MTDYPAASKIEGIFQYRLCQASFDEFGFYLAEDVDITMTGDEHGQVGSNHSKSSFMRELGAMMQPLDPEKRINKEVIRVCGGGESAWAAVECRINGTIKEGKPYNHEWVYMVKFNLKGKVSVLRLYIDTPALVGHIRIAGGPNAPKEVQPMPATDGVQAGAKS